MLSLIAAAGAAPETAPTGPSSTILVLILAGVGVMLLFAYVASKLMGPGHGESLDDEYPIPLDDDLDDD